MGTGEVEHWDADGCDSRIAGLLSLVQHEDETMRGGSGPATPQKHDPETGMLDPDACL